MNPTRPRRVHRLNGWEGFTTVLAGLLAVVLLASSVTLARVRSEGMYASVLRMLSAAGLAATALFGVGLLYHLSLQVSQAFHHWR